jgi:hypothetical protein
MTEFVERYGTHPEAKAAGPDGQPAGEATRGVLGRLHLRGGQPVRIGKEVDRLDEDDDFTLRPSDPIVYGTGDGDAPLAGLGEVFHLCVYTE